MSHIRQSLKVNQNVSEQASEQALLPVLVSDAS